MKINIVLIAVFVLVAFRVAFAMPGDLDPRFGVEGRLVETTLNGKARGVAIQHDGKIVIAVENGWLARYNSDGSPDTTFGVSGRVPRDELFSPEAVAIQADGKIVVAGVRTPCGEQCSALGEVKRFNVDGSLDSTFAYYNLSFFGFTQVLIQQDGKFVLTGPTYGNDFGILRVDLNGSVSWSTVVPFNVSALAIQTDGRVIAAGGDFFVMRLNTDGGPDTSFGVNGIARTYMGGSANSVAIQKDGKIIAGGYGCPGCPEPDYSGFVLVRYNGDGSLDSSFDFDGKVETGITGVDRAYSLALQSDGKILAAGICGWCHNNGDFALIRYNPNGSLDTSFGRGYGISIVDFSGSRDVAYAMAISHQGRAIVVGESNAKPAIARLMLESDRAPFDFDGDGRSDVAVFRPSDSVWYLNRSRDGFTSERFGVSTDKIVLADYDGDGKTDIAIYRNGEWWRINSSDSTVAVNQFGIASDIPVPADYTGDGRDEISVYRSGQWWMLDLANGQASVVNFGLSTDKPVHADFDGDGRVDQAVYRDGEWHLNRSSKGYVVGHFGVPSDIPLTGDYDGDGKADLSVYRNGTWWILRSVDGSALAIQWGLPTDIPAPADYDGDGRTDLAVYRDGQWWMLQSTAGPAVRQFGLAGGQPLAASFNR
jgi:uncharacterized delta-60 repeat protein